VDPPADVDPAEEDVVATEVFVVVELVPALTAK